MPATVTLLTPTELPSPPKGCPGLLKLVAERGPISVVHVEIVIDHSLNNIVPSPRKPLRSSTEPWIHDPPCELLEGGATAIVHHLRVELERRRIIWSRTAFLNVQTILVDPRAKLRIGYLIAENDTTMK
jgi:hypothetical protein